MELFTILSLLAGAFIVLCWHDIVRKVLRKYWILSVTVLAALFYFDCFICKKIIFVAFATAIITAVYLSPKYK
jgi:hypothetical protein